MRGGWAGRKDAERRKVDAERRGANHMIDEARTLRDEYQLGKVSPRSVAALDVIVGRMEQARDRLWPEVGPHGRAIGKR